MKCKSFKFTRHAVEQMFTREILDKDAKKVIRKGKVIHYYSDDEPYPSYLIFAYIQERPLHVLVSVDDESSECIIITAYEPSQDIWKNDYKTRR